MQKKLQSVDIEGEKEYKQWCGKLKEYYHADKFHPLIIEYDKVLKRRKSNEENKYMEDLPFGLRMHNKFSEEELVNDKDVLDINVSDKQLNRAYKFMNLFIRGMKGLGGDIVVDYHIGDNTTITLPYARFKCSLKEKSVKYRDVKAKKSMRPLYDLESTGQFIFSIESNQDGEKSQLSFTEEERKLKEQIEEIFLQFRTLYLQIANNNKQKEEVEEIERAERIKLYEHELLKEKAEEEIRRREEDRERQRKIVLSHAEEWENMVRVESYLSDLQRRMGDEKEDTCLLVAKYCEMVKKLFHLNDFVNNNIASYVEDYKNSQ